MKLFILILLVSSGFGQTNPASYGAVGDGTVDDTASIQQAWNATPMAGTLQFPCGLFNTTAQLNSPIGWRGHIVGCGTGAGIADPQNKYTEVMGTFAGSIFYINSGGGTGGPIVENMHIRNAHTTAGVAITLDGGGLGSTFRNLLVEGWRGIVEVYNGPVYEVSLENNVIVCNNTAVGSGSIGAFGAFTHIWGGKINTCENGIRILGSAGQVISNIDMEVNDIAIVVGRDINGAAHAAGGVTISTVQFEANNTAVLIHAGSSVFMNSLSVQGSTNAPGGQSHYGLRVYGACSTCSVESSTFGGKYDQAAVSLEYPTSSMSFHRVVAGNTFLGGKTWNVLGGLGQYTFSESNFATHLSDIVTATQGWNFTRHVNSQWLGAVDYNHAYVEGKNLGQRDVVVAQSSQVLAVLFSPEPSSGLYGIFSVTPTAGGSLTDGTTYYYCGAMVSSHGETTPSPTGGCGANEKPCMPSGGNLSCTFLFPSGTSFAKTGYRRRVYRSIVSGGPYTGYVEGPMNSDTFIDTGIGGRWQGLTALKDTSRIGDFSTIEADANYAVLVTPNWGTAVWVTNKSTAGFTINFSIPAPAGATCDYFVVRLPGGTGE